MTAPTPPDTAAAWRLPPDPPSALLSFLDNGLPTLLRRLRLWKGLTPDRHQDIIEDLLQELWLDYLTHQEQLLAMTERERHQRWFRLLTRSHYRWREKGHRHLGSETLAELVHEPAVGETANHCLDCLRTHERQLLTQVEKQACYLKNGRLNTQETARRLQVSPQRLRRLWEQVADATGFGDSFLGFWCRRLGEALARLGTDLLEGGDGSRRHLRRIRGIGARLRQRPLPMHLKRLLARYRRRALDLAPAQVLADAASLRPDDPSTLLWLVRAHLRHAPETTTEVTGEHLAASLSRLAPDPDRRRASSRRARQAG